MPTFSDCQGIKFTFPIPHKFKDDFGEDELPLELEDGTTPLVSAISIFYGQG